MFMVDSHCHLNSLDLNEFDDGLDEVIHRANAANIKQLLTISVTLDECREVLLIAEKYEHVHASVGVHPDIIMDKRLALNDLYAYAMHPKCIALGETGLDFYRPDASPSRDEQIERFEIHLELARQVNKPVIIHTRQAVDDTLMVLRNASNQNNTGVMHCFTEEWEVAKACLDLGYYISISGIVTFKNATQIQEVAKKVPSDRLLIETDAPYLAPVPMRGKQNHPALLVHTAKFIADLRGISIETLAEQTTCNFRNLFGVI